MTATDTSRRKIVIAGGSGFIGTALADHLTLHGYQVVILSRSPVHSNSSVVIWDGATTGEWVHELEGAHAIINLAGSSINTLLTEAHKKEILESRVHSIIAIRDAIKLCKLPPLVWIQASAIGVYGDRGEEICSELTTPGEGFLSEVCKAWEQAFHAAASQSRNVIIRIGIVLGKHGGALKPLSTLTKLFLGGAAGSGTQYMSWVHIEDLCAMFRFAIENDSVSGVYNGTAPEPEQNKDFMKTLRAALHRPWSPPVPRIMLILAARFIMRVDPSLILTGNRSLPERFKSQGFQWKFSKLKEALQSFQK